MKADVYSRKQACALQPIEGSVIISISYPEEDAVLQEGWEAVLRLRYHEATRRCDTLSKDPIIFSKYMAEVIDSFVQEHKDKNFVIHCHSGQRRSVAIAMFLKDAFGAEVTAHIGYARDGDIWWAERTSMAEYQILMEPYVSRG